MIIKPITDRKTGKPLTNADVCRRMYDKFIRIKEEKTKSDKLHEYYKMFGGSANEKEVMDFLAEVANAKSEREAQYIIEHNIIPVI